MPLTLDKLDEPLARLLTGGELTDDRTISVAVYCNAGAADRLEALLRNRFNAPVRNRAPWDDDGIVFSVDIAVRALHSLLELDEISWAGLLQSYRVA